MSKRENSGESGLGSADGCVSISLNDSWTGKKLLEFIDHDYSQHMSSEEFQMRYQQKQREEMERKRNEFIGSRGGLSGFDLSESNRIQIGNGKVRQMFDERRQRVTGIDKSYPLQPISSKIVSNNASRQAKNTTSVKRSVNPTQNGFNENPLKLSSRTGHSGDMKIHLPHATTIATNNHFGRSNVSNKLSDIDYIENEQIPDIFSQLDDIDSMESGRRHAIMEKHMANLSVGDENPGRKNGSAKIKLAPVITRKTLSNNSSANSLNTIKRLPPQPVKARSIPITPEKSAFSQKNESSWPTSPTKKVTNGSATSSSHSGSSRSSASSNASAKNAVNSGPPPPGMASCRICGRHFNEDRVQKHESICKKTTTKKRKVFDATKHRVEGTEAEAYVKKSAKFEKRKTSPPTKKSNWRRTHEEFIQAIRSAKAVKQHLASGGKLSDLPPPPPSENPDYVKCPHCGRSFNESAAARHIPKCQHYDYNKPKASKAPARKRF